MSTWVATSLGALDLRGSELEQNNYETVIAPARGAEPVFLFGEGAVLWRRLVTAPVDDSFLDDSERAILDDFAAMGIASSEPADPSRVTAVDRPWLLSPLHELVYAILAGVAARHSIDIIFIKGPTLFAQGLREREHSGDVDCWVRREDERRLAEAMVEWGWTPLYSPFAGTGLPHSLTLRAGSWGCAIDVHTRFPGMTIDPAGAFDVIHSTASRRSFASIRVLTPSPSAHAVIAALHEVRPYRGTPAASYQFDSARHILRAAGIEVIDMVARLGAGHVLSRPLQEAFPDVDTRTEEVEEPADWRWRLTPEGPVRHLRALALVPVLQRPRVLKGLVWPSVASMRISHEIPDASVRQLMKMRLERILRMLQRHVRKY